MSNACLKSATVQFADAHPAVDLFAAIAPRKSQREPAVDDDLAAVLLHAPARDVDVGVLNHERRLAASPSSRRTRAVLSAANVPSTRGRLNDSIIVPVNSAVPPTVIGLVGAPNAVMMPASTRSLSCKSALARETECASCRPRRCGRRT